VSDDGNEELISDLKKVMDAASDTVSVEAMSASLKNIGIILVTFRKFMTSSGFSDDWAERACAALWNSFFPSHPMEGS